VWNHQHRRLARYWSAGAGLDDTVIDALRTRKLDRLDVVAPTADELARQLLAELPVSRRHLRTVVERNWDLHEAAQALALSQPGARVRLPDGSAGL